jgi:hypothetical protein
MIVAGSSFRCGFMIESIAQAIEEWHRNMLQIIMLVYFLSDWVEHSG